MANPYIGEIRIFAFNFAPTGWALCNGQLLPIAQNTALFSLLGTSYGGDGMTTFALPDLQSRVPIHQGTGAGLSAYTIGEESGNESATLTIAQMPEHTHLVNATTTAGSGVATPENSLHAIPVASPRGTAVSPYSTAAANVTMAEAAISAAGGSQPVSVLQPALCVNFCIALTGLFPGSS